MHDETEPPDQCLWEPPVCFIWDRVHIIRGRARGRVTAAYEVGVSLIIWYCLGGVRILPVCGCGYCLGGVRVLPGCGDGYRLGVVRRPRHVPYAPCTIRDLPTVSVCSVDACTHGGAVGTFHHHNGVQGKITQSRRGELAYLTSLFARCRGDLDSLMLCGSVNSSDGMST